MDAATEGVVVFGWLVSLSGIQAEVVEFGGEVLHADGVGESAGFGCGRHFFSRAINALTGTSDDGISFCILR